ncbi:MAG: PolC-type DNA polymerase III, partial [Spirochaetia bacterium]
MITGECGEPREPRHNIKPDCNSNRFETTGLNPAKDAITEVGIIRYEQGAYFNYSRLVNPGMAISKEAARISGITNEMVSAQPVIADVFQEFLPYLENTLLIAHNAVFDLSFLNAALRLSGLPLYSGEVLDTRLLCKHVYPFQKSYTLQNLAKALMLESKEAHRAGDDARICLEIFMRCI